MRAARIQLSTWHILVVLRSAVLRSPWSAM